MKSKKYKIQESLMSILDKKQLNEIDLEEIFENTKIKNKQLSNLYKNKELILKDFFQRIDSILEKKIKKTDLGVNIKDNLFEIIMIRFDILYPYKKSIKNLYLSIKNKPKIFFELQESFFETMNNMLLLSNIQTDPIKGHLKLIFFSIVYLSILKEWFADNTKNNEKTMATLDKRLSLIENLIIKVN